MERKLADLENKQFDLVRENYELKQLCLLLDAQQSNNLPPVANENHQQFQRQTGHAQVLTQQILAYIRSLESRIRSLEPSTTMQHDAPSDKASSGEEPELSPPEAIIKAMKVLNVHESASEVSSQESASSAAESAIVRQMCNVVWRKIEEGS